ncbi:MAG: hypothetical protein NC310_01980 [Roseburia sp.]|nr:hypothetical protein [Roseburia sp.]MCM1556294.1 hypothetical protein [Anaeroplasma bactoclasticum]
MFNFFKKRKLAKLRKKEEQCKREFYSFLDSPLYLSLTDKSMDQENYLLSRYEWAIEDRINYEKTVMSKPRKKANKKGIKYYGKKEI